MSAACPTCNKPLPATVASGPAQAVVRCEGCQTLLLWSNGRVMRSARSSTTNMPAVKPPEDKPLTALLPEADTKVTPPPAKPSAPAAKPAAAKTVMGIGALGENVPTKVTATPPDLRKAATPPAAAAPAPSPPRKDATLPPMKASGSGPIAAKTAPLPAMKPSGSGPIATRPAAKPEPKIEAKPAAKPEPKPQPKLEAKPPAKPETKPETKIETKIEATAEPKGDDGKPSMVAAVAEVPKMGTSGPMVDPAAWFKDSSDVVPPEKAGPLIESTRPQRRDSTGAQPLPPPPTVKPLPPAEPFIVAAPTAEPPLRDELDAPIPLEPEEPEEIESDKPEPFVESASARRYKGEGNAYARDIGAAVFAGESSNEATETFADKLSDSALKAEAAKPRPKATLMGIPPMPLKTGAAAPMARTTSGAIGREAEDKTPSAPIATGAAATGAPKAAATAPTMMGSAPTMMATGPALGTAPTMMGAAPPASQLASAPTMMAAAPTGNAASSPPLREMNAPHSIAGDTSAPDLPPPPAMLPRANAGEPMLETDQVRRVGPLLSRRTLMIAGGAGGALLLVVLILALGHGSSKPPATATTRPAEPTVAKATPPIAPPNPAPPIAQTRPTPPAPTPPGPAPTPPRPPTPRATPPAPAAVAVAPPSEPPPSEEPPPPPEPSGPAPRRSHTLGGKKVVLEYDPKPTSPTPPPPTAPVPSGEDPATVARARESYHKGNVKLFSGDTAAAIALYRESLKIYPGYVAGYRGLGLGYEQGGQTQQALEALRTYVRTVPHAHDVELIKKRIEHLESVQSNKD